MNVPELLGDVAEAISDPSMGRVNADRLLRMLNTAAQDAKNEGWYLPIADDESITLANDTWEYDVPADFVLVKELYVENTDGEFTFPVYAHMWDIALTSGGPVIRFLPHIFPLQPDRALRVQGQTRPGSYTLARTAGEFQDIEPGMESFLRERTVSYAARFLARPGTADFEGYDRKAGGAFLVSERMLHSHPQGFRMDNDARYVLGR